MATLKLTVDVPDKRIQRILEDSNYKLRIGQPSKVPFQDHTIHPYQKDSHLAPPTYELDFVPPAQGRVHYWIAFHSKTGPHYRLPIFLGQIYEINHEDVAKVRDPVVPEKSWVPKDGFGIINHKCISLMLYRSEPGEQFDNIDATSGPWCPYKEISSWSAGTGTLVPRPHPTKIQVWFEIDEHEEDDVVVRDQSEKFIVEYRYGVTEAKVAYLGDGHWHKETKHC